VADEGGGDAGWVGDRGGHGFGGFVGDCRGCRDWLGEKKNAKVGKGTRRTRGKALGWGFGEGGLLLAQTIPHPWRA
jgi:hypothetical protein